jgi:hypothetical protein
MRSLSYGLLEGITSVTVMVFLYGLVMAFGFALQ